MTTVIDYTTNWGGFASAADIKAHGFAGILRYLSHNPAKDLTPTERDEALAAGLTIGLVWESTANRAGQGQTAGVEDATYANRLADQLGYPKTCTLWYAVDYDADAPAVQPYFDGVASVGGRTHAPYGDVKVIDGVTYPGHGWQTVAWSNHHTSTRAGLIQNSFHGSYDINGVLIADYGQWQPNAPAPQPDPHPSPEDYDMPIICRPVPSSGTWPDNPNGDPDIGAEYVLAGDKLIALASDDEKQQFINSGFATHDFETHAWARLKHGCTVVG